MSEETQAEAVETEEVRDETVDSSTTNETEPKGETEPEASGEAEQKKDDLPAGVKKRFSELTRDKYQLKEEIRKRDELIEKLKPFSAPQEPVKPKFSDFDSDADYESAMTTYADNIAEYRAKKREQEIEDNNRVVQRQQARAQNQAKYLEALKEQQPLFDDFMGKLSDPLASSIINQYPQDIVDIIWASEKGPALSYHLATHLDDAEKIASMSPLQASYELARIESRIELPKPKTVSNAPDPIKQVNANGQREKDLSDPNLSDDEWNALRRKQIKARGGRA